MPLTGHHHCSSGCVQCSLLTKQLRTCPFSICLKFCTETALTTPDAREFHGATTRLVKKCCLTFRELHFTESFRLCPRVTEFTLISKKSSHFKAMCPCTILKHRHRSACNQRSSNDAR